jgi:hypothetical protein
MVLAIALMLLAIVQALLVSLSFNRANDDLNTVHNGSTPSVDAAQAIAQYIDDIDAKSADFLATDGLTQQELCSLPGAQPSTMTVHDCDYQTINAEIILTNQQLFKAAHNVTYPGEQTAVERITEGFEEYTGHITAMRTYYDLASQTANQHDRQTWLLYAYNAYKAAGAVLHQHIEQPSIFGVENKLVTDEQQPLPGCMLEGQSAPIQPDNWASGSLKDNIDCLSYINKSHLNTAYQDTQDFLGITILLVGSFCLVFCLLLLFVSGRMTFITHRVINIGLTLAVLLAIGLSIASVSLFMDISGSSGSFKQMVKDDYDSVYYAALLKRYGTDANADESRWLIALKFNDPAQADAWFVDWQTNTQQVQALIDRAQANRTWPEEDLPLADMHTYWSQYFSIDAQIRSDANDTKDANRINTAETLSTGDSNIAFGKFSDAVDRLGQANRSHYDGTYQSTQQALTIFIFLSAILFPLIGLCAVWGVSRRLRDF